MIKKLSFAGIIFMAAILIGCKKFPDKIDVVPLSLFKFTANGVTDSIVATMPTNSLMDVSITPITYNSGTTPFTRYKLSAFRKNPFREMRDDYRIQFHLTTEVLAVQEYSYSFPTNPSHYSFLSETGRLDDVDYSSIASRDEFKVTITKIQNGYADGTFSGILSNFRCFGISSCTLPRLEISNGVFKNVRILK